MQCNYTRYVMTTYSRIQCS